MHAETSCPGEYLLSKMDYIVEEANKINNEVTSVPEPEPVPTPEPVPPVLKTNEEIANEVISGIWGNGNDRKVKLTDAGYDYSSIQKIVNEKLLGSTPTEKPKKLNEELAQEVISGNWGNGEERKKRLTEAGYNFDEIQTIVNNKLGADSSSSNKKSNDEVAYEVIRGDWGNGEERKNKLTQAGYDYDTIQKIVNDRLK